MYTHVLPSQLALSRAEHWPPDACRERPGRCVQAHLSGGWDTVGAFPGGSPGCAEHSELGFCSFLLTDQGRGWLDASNQPELSFQPQYYLLWGEELYSQGPGASQAGGWEDSYPSPSPLFGCESQLLQGRNVPLFWNSLSFSEPSDRSIHALSSTVPQEGPLVSVWQLQGTWAHCWGILRRPHLTFPQGELIASALVGAST